VKKRKKTFFFCSCCSGLETWNAHTGTLATFVFSLNLLSQSLTENVDLIIETMKSIPSLEVRRNRLLCSFSFSNQVVKAFSRWMRSTKSCARVPCP
jgi:hypothetical protein